MQLLLPTLDLFSSRRAAFYIWLIQFVDGVHLTGAIQRWHPIDYQSVNYPRSPDTVGSVHFLTFLQNLYWIDG